MRGLELEIFLDLLLDNTFSLLVLLKLRAVIFAVALDADMQCFLAWILYVLKLGTIFVI